MIERIRVIREKGKDILLFDASDCRPSEVEAMARALPGHVTTQARGSVRMLVDFSGASVDEETVRTMKETAVFNKAYIKKSAWIGMKNFPQKFHTEITHFSRREMPMFNSRDEAVEWLLRD